MIAEVLGKARTVGMDRGLVQRRAGRRALWEAWMLAGGGRVGAHGWVDKLIEAGIGRERRYSSWW